MSSDVDLFVIGAGSGGVRAARMAAAYGARVTIAEERYYGGTCVNVGCIPKKLLVYAAHVSDEVADAAGFGWTIAPPSFDWRKLIENKDREITRLSALYADVLDKAGARRIDGRARILDPHTVAVGEARFRAEHILVATGGWPVVPEIPGIEHAISSNEVFHLGALPRHVVIVGGGYIALEFAGIFHGLGAEVTVVHRGPLLLRGFDEEVRRHLGGELQRRGIDLRFERHVVAVQKAGAEGRLRAELDDGSVAWTDKVLFATGRGPSTRGLGLEAAGVALDERGAVKVDEYSRSSVPSVWALGDVTDRLNLTPVAIHEAMAFAKTVFGGAPTPRDHENVPTCVFSTPEVATVGLTEEEARSRHPAVDVYRSSFRPLKHALSGRDTRALVKLVVDGASDRVLGCHIVGDDAAEMLQGFAVAIKCGATKAQLDATIGIHPTAAEELVTLREKVV